MGPFLLGDQFCDGFHHSFVCIDVLIRHVDTGERDISNPVRKHKRYII